MIWHIYFRFICFSFHGCMSAKEIENDGKGSNAFLWLQSQRARNYRRYVELCIGGTFESHEFFHKFDALRETKELTISKRIGRIVPCDAFVYTYLSII